MGAVLYATSGVRLRMRDGEIEMNGVAQIATLCQHAK